MNDEIKCCMCQTSTGDIETTNDGTPVHRQCLENAALGKLIPKLFNKPKTFTIEEIKEWLNGQILSVFTDNIGTLKKVDCESNKHTDFLVKELEDPEDGLEAVTDRLKACKNWSND